MSDLNWRDDVWRITLWLIPATLFGFFSDTLAWCYLAVTAIFLYRVWRNLSRLQQWLNETSNQEPPDMKGMLGQIVEKIYRQRKHERQERIRLRATISYFRESVKSLPFGVVMVNAEGAIEWVNDAAVRLLGLRQPEDVGQALVNLIRSPDFLRYYLRKKYSEPFLMMSTFDAHIRLRISVTEVGRGNRIVFAQDYSREYQLEEVRKHFISNASHELRTPLTVIHGYLETLAELPDVTENARLHRAIEQMILQSRRMMELIADLLVLSRLETKPKSLQTEKILLKPLLESVAKESAMIAPDERTILIECADDIRLVGDVAELRSCIANLVNNAVKYGRFGGNVWVSWHTKNDAGYLQIKDDGIGIDQIHLPHLTERFYRVDESRTVATGGTGLGLAIVKHILMRHDATLKIESELDHGSTFTCIFPSHRICIEKIENTIE